MTSNVTDPLESKLLETATAYQQNYYEICSDWNRYESDELDYLKDYIGYAVCGPPALNENVSKDKEKDENKKSDEKSFFSYFFNTKKAENEKEENLSKNEIENNENRDAHDSGHFVYDEKQQLSINLIYEKVMEYGNCEQSGGMVLCGIIYNVIFNKEQALQKKNAESEDATAADENQNKDEAMENKDEERMLECAEPEIQIFPVPVFKVRRYRDPKMKKESEKANKSGAIDNTEKIYYIDNSGRVYDGFKDYLENNTLPKCTMVLPKDGRYQIDPIFCTRANLDKEKLDEVVTTVWLEIHESPASNLAAKVLMGGDIASTIVTVASMGVGIASLVTPIGAGLALATAVGAGVSGVWTVGRSAQQLADRGQHGESINVTDKTALGAWIGIAGGTMGLAATGSTVLLSRAIRTGATVGRAATVAYDAVLIGNLIVNGVGVGFKSYDIYAIFMDTGEISAQDILFLTAHMFFFCNSVVNIRFAQSIVETSQGQLLKDYEASLRSNRHRREFQRMARNTRAAGVSDVSSNEEIIRGINKIANKDEFFQAMVRNSKPFSASSAKASFSNGKVIVNSVLTIDPIEFSTLPKDIRADIVRSVSSVDSINSADTKPNNLAGSKPNIFAGAKPNNSAGTKPNNSAGTKPNNSAGTKPNNSAGTKPNNSAGTKPNNSAGTKPNNSAGTKPNNSAGTKPNNSAGTKPNTSAGTKPDNSAGKTQNNSGEINKPTTRTNETSYKNFTANNGAILKEFCLKHSNAMLQTAPPKIADFAVVLIDLQTVQNSAVIFVRLLEIGYKILQAIPRDEAIKLGDAMAAIVQFLWDYIKTNMRRIRPGTMIGDPSTRELLDKLMQELWYRVEEKLDIWIEAFKEWLKTNFPECINGPFLNDSHK